MYADKYVDKMIIATLIKLFTTKIVARSLSGFINSFWISRAVFVFEYFILFLSFGDKLKNAISLAETDPERNNKITIAIELAITELIEVGAIDSSIKQYLKGSGSKVI